MATKTGDRVYAFHDGQMKRARVQGTDEAMGVVFVSFEDKSTGVVAPTEIAPLYRWVSVEGKGEYFYPLFELNGVHPPQE